jgi:hypothetical protein
MGGSQATHMCAISASSKVHDGKHEEVPESVEESWRGLVSPEELWDTRFRLPQTRVCPDRVHGP